jgi:peptidyl-prolyl cis-trans isomerase C
MKRLGQIYRFHVMACRVRATPGVSFAFTTRPPAQSMTPGSRQREPVMYSLPVFRPSNPLAAARVAVIWLAAMLGTAGPTFANSPSVDPVIAVVNGAEIHESDLRLADETIGRNLPTMDQVERRQSITAMLIDATLLSQAAKDQKIGDEADLQRRMTYARNQGLMNELLAVTGQRAITEKAVHKAYEELVVKNAIEPELHLRHLFFKISDPQDEAAVKAAEERAKLALDRIKKGEDFAAVVTDMSEDPTAKAKGGDFDWRTRDEMGKEYADVAFTLKTGDVSPLIKTSFGWHIIKLEDQRTRKPADFDKVRDRLAAVVARAAQFELVDRLRAEAKIERLDQPNRTEKDKQAGQ